MAPTNLILTRLATVVALTALAACGGGATVTPGPGAGSGGSATDSGVPGTGGGGAAGIGGGSGSSGVVDGAAACTAQTAFTLAIHVVVDVSWPDTPGNNSGTGKMHLRSLARMIANGTSLSGVTQPCGSDLPDLTLKPLAGGGRSVLDIPNAIWDGPAATKDASVGMISGWNPGSMLSTEATSVLTGLTLPDPNGAWPASHDLVMAVDADGDGQPGITAIPRMGNGYVQPPIPTIIPGLVAKADKVYLVSRTAVALNGMVSSCTQQSGTATVRFFDNHIVGCHVSGGGECTRAQVDFLDMNRTRFVVMGGTFTAKLVPDTATCADARAM